MCLCRNLGLLKESGQYSTLAPNNHNPRRKDRPVVQMVDPWSDSRERDTV